MKQDASPAHIPTSKPDEFSVRVQIYKDIADITWRMFAPSIGGCVLGVIADRIFGTTPWCTVAGVTLGFVIVGFLVWQQIRNTKEVVK